MGLPEAKTFVEFDPAKLTADGYDGISRLDERSIDTQGMSAKMAAREGAKFLGYSGGLDMGGWTGDDADDFVKNIIGQLASADRRVDQIQEGFENIYICDLRGVEISSEE